MGTGSNWAVEVDEEKAQAEWIRKKLKNSDADESTEGWDKLAIAYGEREFDEISDNHEDALAQQATEDYLDEVRRAEYLKEIESNDSKIAE